MDNLIGKIVCGYRIISEVGEGGMGKVYLAESAFLTEYKQQVAVKTLITQASTERQSAILRDLFTREANIQVQFKHPQIVSVIQFAVEGDHHFLILEYMPGYQHRNRHISNIAEMIAYETGPVPHKRALRLFAQALDAMQYAHNFKYKWEGEERVGIVHRDIKPANLLLLDPETIKVSDFGIVKVQQRTPGATQKLTPGTSAYMSPEAILGPHQYGLDELDARSDIYSLGVTLYEMLAGRVPFSPDPSVNPDVSLRRKQVHENPPPPSAYYPGLSPQLDQLVLRALEKRPEARYQSAAEFKEAIVTLDSQLDLGLRDTAATREFETTPFTPSTDKNSAKTTAATARVSATAGSAYYAPDTSVVTRQPGLTTPAEERARSSKSLLLIGVAVVALAVVAVLAIQKFRGKAQTNSDVVETIDPPRIPEGMVLIPEGSFMMGRNLTDEEKKSTIEAQGRQVAIFSYDWPAHLKSLSAFYMDRTEVSNAQYAEFVKATGHPAPANWEAATPPPHAHQIPVTDVTYQDAVDYCAWRSTQRNDGVKFRLPTEEEWEYAARGKDAGKPGARMNLYPWGDEWVEGNANTKESRLDFPRNVDQYPIGKSQFDILNLSGNVAEWTASDFSHYPGSDQKTPREPGYEGTYQVVRGGGFAFPKEYAMTTTRVWARPENKGPKLGFRCAADAKR
ncbi:MAG TPA: bifunctional serine/threonine-protein kinase/formylglycine-generating enzyme family protein [Blastocatellia bacterium]|nr:bifunctional serine/threonine-protein kinase/formylglycine-generating enzyme family protein [Blastocatellia bacterium]